MHSIFILGKLDLFQNAATCFPPQLLFRLVGDKAADFIWKGVFFPCDVMLPCMQVKKESVCVNCHCHRVICIQKHSCKKESESPF